MFLAVAVLVFLSGVSAKPANQRYCKANWRLRRACLIINHRSGQDWDYFMFVQENPAGFCLVSTLLDSKLLLSMPTGRPKRWEIATIPRM